MRGDDFAPPIVRDRGEPDAAPVPVDAGQRSIEVAISPAVAVAAIAHFVEVRIQRSGGDLVQQRLPDMRAVAVDKDDVVMLAPIVRAQLGRQFQSRRSAADDHDLGLHRRGWNGC